MNETVRHTNVWLWITFPVAILLTIAAGGGVFIMVRDARLRRAPHHEVDVWSR